MVWRMSSASHRMPNKCRIGVALALHDSAAVLEECLLLLSGSGLTIVAVDDGSTDATASILASFPDVIHISTDGSRWWAGATEIAVQRCLAEGCEYIVLLNPDVRIEPSAIAALVEHVAANPKTVAAPLLVSHSNPHKVAWAGSTFGRRWPHLPIYSSKYLVRPTADVSSVPTRPYLTDEVHGRGVVLRAELIDSIGLFRADRFPHYGADNDFSFRARRAGYSLQVVPSVRARLIVEHSGMKESIDSSPVARLRRTGAYLCRRRNGEALRVWWLLLAENVPRRAFLPSFLFHILVGSFRAMTP